MILGIDEVGRGPWAGPLVVGAVVLGSKQIEGLTDSKKLSKKRREELAEEIYKNAHGLGIGWVHANEIDKLGLSEALVLATIRAVSQVNCSYNEIIIDGTINFLKDTGKGRYVTTLKKADLLIPSVSAASIIAKVARDTYMEEMAENYPGYGFERHVGYGTAVHRAAIDRLGVTPLHRLSFAPLARHRTEETAHSRVIPVSRAAVALTTKQIGDKAEEVTVEYLRKNGHRILDRNWKTKFCEIDVVSRKSNVIYFTEVKYRKNINYGGGIGAITPKKLKRMRFASNNYVAYKKIHNDDLCLAVAVVSGERFELTDYLELNES